MKSGNTNVFWLNIYVYAMAYGSHLDFTIDRLYATDIYKKHLLKY